MNLVGVSKDAMLLLSKDGTVTLRLEILTSSGFLTTCENGRIFFPGYPLTTSRISILTGMLVSLVAKNKSTDVKNAPPFC